MRVIWIVVLLLMLALVLRNIEALAHEVDTLECVDNSLRYNKKYIWSKDGSLVHCKWSRT